MKNYKELLNELPSKSVVFTAGRFNPPNVGHELSIKVVRKLASQRKADHFIFVSSVQDAKKNPLEVSKKIQYLGILFPNTKFVQKEIEELSSILKKYKSITMVVAAESEDYYKKVLKKIGITDVEFVKAGSNCPDEDDKLLKLASKGNYQSFKTSLPTTIRELDAKRLMNDIRIGLELEPIKEQINLVKDNLREQYFRGEIFKEGDIVECNDAVYKIIKRGSNHLLLQNEEGLKVSKWIQDVQLTERQFMLNEKLLQEADATSATGHSGISNKAAEKAKADSEKARLVAAQAEEKAKLVDSQRREMDNLKTQLRKEDSPVVNTKSKYNIAKSVMSLSDFRKTMKQSQPDGEKDEKKIADTVHDGLIGNSHLHTDHSMRHRKVKYHLGEETDEQQAARKIQLKRFKDQAAGAKLTCEGEQYAGLEKEDKPGKKKTEMKGTRNSVSGETVEGWKDEDIGFKHTKTAAVKEEFDDINEEELIALVEADLDSLTEEDFYEAYEEDELAIIDDETGEEIEAVAEEVTLDSPALMEVLSRMERIKARARMRRSQAKRQRREKVALRQLSSPQVANRRARRMAVSALKKRLLRGQNPNKISVGQKERIERFIQQRRKIVDRLSARMVSRVKQVEKARMSHKKFTKPNNGVAF